MCGIHFTPKLSCLIFVVADKTWDKIQMGYCRDNVFENRNYYIARSFPDISRCTDHSPDKWIGINETYYLTFYIPQTRKPQVWWIGLEVGDLTLYKYNFPWNKKGTAYKCWFIILIYFFNHHVSVKYVQKLHILLDRVVSQKGGLASKLDLLNQNSV